MSVFIVDLTDSEPSVYQLKSKNEQSNVAACLITDYSPNPIDVKTKRNSNSNSASGSVVVVKDGNNKESASLGVVRWDKNDDQFHCSATYKGTHYEAENQGKSMKILVFVKNIPDFRNLSCFLS